MSFEKYITKKKQVIEILKDIEAMVEDNSTKSFIKNKIDNIHKDRFIISVFGHFSNGKSTFLNALMGFGEQVLVEDELASTATITKLKYPEKKELLHKAEILYTNGEKELISMEELKQYSARNKEYSVETLIKEVILYLDSDYLKNGVEIVDTPGFNSTYTLHTDIAKKHVENSDASIFLFNYEKPGSEEEFKFLNYINRYMNRVFFAMNKIDLFDKSENNIEDTVDDLIHKMVEKKIEVEGKEVYPISAQLAKAAIREKSEGKREASRFEVFKEALSNYLTSEENLRDRLLEPLSAVESKLKQERELIQERIRIYSKDQEELLKELDNKKKIIEECENSLKEKKKFIHASVRNAIRNAKEDMANNTEAVLEEIKDELKEVNSEFDLRLTVFSSMAINVYDKFLKNWSTVKNKLEDQLLELIEENIDSDSELEAVRNKLMATIDRSLNIERADVEDPKIDLSELNKIDKEIEKRKLEYEGYREKLLKCKDDKNKYNMLSEQKEKLEREIDKLKETREIRLESIGEARPQTVRTTRNIEQKRGGLFGGIGNFLFGPKVVSKSESYVDYSEVEFVEKQKNIIQQNYSSEIAAKESEIEKKIYELIVMGDIESQILDLEMESKEYRQRYLKKLEREDEEKQKLASRIIRVSRDNYFKEIKKASEEYEEHIQKFLDDQKDLIVKIIQGALEGESSRLQDMKNNLYNMSSMANTNPDELQQEIRGLYDQVEKLMSGIEIIKKAKEGEI